MFIQQYFIIHIHSYFDSVTALFELSPGGRALTRLHGTSTRLFVQLRNCSFSISEGVYSLSFPFNGFYSERTGCEFREDIYEFSHW